MDLLSSIPSVLERAGGRNQQRLQRLLAHRPISRGGLLGASAALIAPAAHWGSCADVIPVLHRRYPHLAEQLLHRLGAEDDSHIDCIDELRAATSMLDAKGFAETRPSWEAILAGARPPPPDDLADEPGWKHGFQFYASAVLLDASTEQELIPLLSRAERAMLLSSTGLHAGDAFRAIPTCPELRIQSETLQTMLRRRLRIVIPPPWADRCDGCGAALDRLGDHRCACMRTGRVAQRAKPTEYAWQKVTSEGGARVAGQSGGATLVRRLCPEVSATCADHVDFVARGLPFGRGLPYAADCTLISVLHGDGTPWADADTTPGIRIRKAEERKANTEHPLLARSPHCHLLVLACEVGGRFSDTSIHFVQQLAWNKTRHIQNPTIRRLARATWMRRWWGILSVALHTSVARCVTEFPVAIPDCAETIPHLGDIFGRGPPPPEFSRTC